MVNIYVARHGQDLDNVKGILNGHRNLPLTDLGRQQATDVANKMVCAGFTLSSASGDAPTSSSKPDVSTALSAVYSSPLKRAHETAEIFAKILSGKGGDDADPSIDDATIKVEVLDDLIERDFGIMSGQPTSSIVEKCGADHILATEKINYFLGKTRLKSHTIVICIKDSFSTS